MNHSLELVLRSVGLIGALVTAYWIWQDATRLKRRGAAVSRGLWTVLGLLVWLPTLLAYLFLRSRYWRKQMGRELEPAPAEPRGRSDGAQAEAACSEATIRALARQYADRPPREAWRDLREHYYRHSCADEMDLDRFEEIVAETLRP